MLCEVFPLQMICISKNLPSIVILNVAVIVLLPVDPATESLLIPLGVCILLQPGTCFDGVQSRFITIDFCILLFSVMETIECKSVVSTSSRTSFDISTFPVAAIRRTKPIFQKRLSAQLNPSRLIWVKLNSGCLLIRAFPVAIAMAFEITPSRARTPYN